MSKFCSVCGAELSEGTTFCSNCGMHQSNLDETNVISPKKSNGFFAYIKNHSWVKILAVILVVILVGNFLFSQPYKSAVSRMVDVYEGEVDKIPELMPEEYWEWYEDKYDKSPDDVVKESKAAYKYSIKEREKELGDNIEISYKIIDEEKLNDDELDEIQDGLKKKYGISRKNVKKAYRIALKFTHKGDKDEEITYNHIIMTKIGSDWYPTTDYGSFAF